MAWEKDLFTIPAALAGADLSGNQFYCVKVTTTNNTYILTTVAGEEFDGVLQNKPTSGNAAEVRSAGVTKVIAGETLTAGDLWGCGADGKAYKVESTATGADVGSYYAGRILEGGASGEKVTATIGMTTGTVEA